MSDTGEGEFKHESLSDVLLAQLEAEIASGDLKLPAKDWVRPLSFRKVAGRESANELKNVTMKRAAYGQATGKQVPRHLWCQTCSSGRGLFTSCVVAVDGTKLLGNGTCMGCMSLGHSGQCSFNSEDGAMPRFVLNYAQSLGRGAISTIPNKRKTASDVLTTPTKAKKSSKASTPGSAADTPAGLKYELDETTMDDLTSLIKYQNKLQADVSKLKADLTRSECVSG